MLTQFHTCISGCNKSHIKDQIVVQGYTNHHEIFGLRGQCRTTYGYVCLTYAATMTFLKILSTYANDSNPTSYNRRTHVSAVSRLGPSYKLLRKLGRTCLFKAQVQDDSNLARSDLRVKWMNALSTKINFAARQTTAASVLDVHQYIRIKDKGSGYHSLPTHRTM